MIGDWHVLILIILLLQVKHWDDDDDDKLLTDIVEACDYRKQFLSEIINGIFIHDFISYIHTEYEIFNNDCSADAK